MSNCMFCEENIFLDKIIISDGNAFHLECFLAAGLGVYIGNFQRKQHIQPIPKKCFEYQILLGWTEDKVLVLSHECLRVYSRKDWEKRKEYCSECGNTL